MSHQRSETPNISSGSGRAAAPVISVTPANPVSNANLAGLGPLQTAVDDQLNKIADPTVRQSLIDRVKEDRELLQKSSIGDFIGGGSKKTGFKTFGSDHSKNLKERLDNTQKMIQQASLDQATQLAILQATQREHDTELQMVKDYIDTQAQKTKDVAYDQLKAGNMNSTAGPGAPSPTSGQKAGKSGSFLDTIASMSPPTMHNYHNPNPNFPYSSLHYSLGDGSIEGNDPREVGLALAAAGYDPIENLAGKPWDMIIAAKAALNSGVEEINFNKGALEVLLNPYNGLYNEGEYEVVKREYDAIINRMSAIRSAKMLPNSVFNTNANALSKTAQIFSHMNSRAPGHAQMLEGLSAEERAMLADETKSRTYVANHVPYNGLDYIRYHLRISGEEHDLQNFEEAFANLESKKYTPDFLKLTDTKQIVDYIFDKCSTVESRSRMYDQIQNLKVGKDAQNEIRANIISRVLDNNLDWASTRAAQKTPPLPGFLGDAFKAVRKHFIKEVSPTVLKAHRQEIETLYATFEAQDLDDIQQKLDDSYCRIKTKEESYQQTHHGESAFKIDPHTSKLDLSKSYPEDLYDENEGIHDKNLLTDDDAIARYAQLKGITYEVKETLSKNALKASSDHPQVNPQEDSESDEASTSESEERTRSRSSSNNSGPLVEVLDDDADDDQSLNPSRHYKG